ncbi:RNA-binding protein 2-like isoform X2 [Nicotiana tomentosiformis]|uniref:RNA-binding protein 2-like isoform X2 n=1 Tax=Nicotiana tomentosiformis TaxID=4098 RepID=UPI00051C58C2|nr:RNA-binding protein 2-like isoform X3 [Nicotiana tomentosiformis]
MADAYWRYTSGGQQAAALPPQLVAKRPRTEYDVPSGPEFPGYYGRDDERGMPRVIRDTDPIEASYERYLRCGQISSHVASESARSINSGISGHPIEDPRVMGIGGPDPLALKSRNVGMVGGRPEISLPPDASSTLFVEGLPADCTRREVSHIFRPFVGYKEVRLVPKGSRHLGGDPLILCFVDFVTPLHAAAAMDALQGLEDFARIGVLVICLCDSHIDC